LFSGDCLKPFDGVMVTDNRCTLFECMIRSKLRDFLTPKTAFRKGDK
jgi:hypothetical protein